MDKKEFIIVNTVLIFIMLFVSYITFDIFTNRHIKPVVATKNQIVSELRNGKSEKTKVQLASNNMQEQTNCSAKQMLPLTFTNDENLQQLSKYQSMCNSFVTSNLMFFTTMPSGEEQAITEGKQMAEKLKHFSENGISPIVIVEPYAGENLVSFADFENGSYNKVLKEYFLAIKNEGITDAMMGTWVPFPEFNTPNWGTKNVSPKDFAACVNVYLSALKENFPNAKGSILLNSATYKPSDVEWNSGDYLGFSPYLEELKPDLIDSFGIQGFPWVSAANNQRREIFRASEFLQPDLAIDAARQLQVKDIWFNTGTFASKYTNDSEKQIFVSLNDRKSILRGILVEAMKIKMLQLNEYRVSINLFAQDKSDSGEATDWSYFQNEDSQQVLKEFLQLAEKENVPISLFDKAL